MSPFSSSLVRASYTLPSRTSPPVVRCLLQSGLRRTIELTEAAIREINRRNLVSSALLARGALETSSLLWDVMMQVERVVQEADTTKLKPFYEALNKASFGGKAKSVMIDQAIEPFSDATPA